MKKLTAFITCLFVMACMTSCDNNEECNHKWVDATCEEPKTCSLCKETEGEKLGHKWVDATCTEPKTCSLCKETEGEKLGHKWVDATCTEPKTCSLCKETDGEKLEHKWVDATCTEPKTCSLCNETAGRQKGHVASQNVLEETDFKTASVTYKTYCAECGEDMDKKVEKLSQLHENGAFLFTANELCDRMNHIFKSDVKWKNYSADIRHITETDGTELMILGVFNPQGEIIGTIRPFDYDIEPILDADSASISAIQLFAFEDEYNMILITPAAHMACDPKLDIQDAVDAIDDFLICTGNAETYEKNDIYMFFIGDNWEYLWFTLM